MNALYLLIPLAITLIIATIFANGSKKVSVILSKYNLPEFEKDRLCHELTEKIIKGIKKIPTIAEITILELAGEADPWHQEKFIEYLYTPLQKLFAKGGHPSKIKFEFYGGDKIIIGNDVTEFTTAHPWFKFVEESKGLAKAYLTASRIPIHGIYIRVTDINGKRYYSGLKEDSFHFETFSPSASIMSTKSDIQAIEDVFREVHQKLIEKSVQISSSSYASIKDRMIEKTIKRERAVNQRAKGYGALINAYIDQVRQMYLNYGVTLMYGDKGSLKVVKSLDEVSDVLAS